MSSGAGKTRAYGSFPASTKAADLFDAAFGKAQTRRRFPKAAPVPPENDDKPQLPSVTVNSSSPQQVFSPPVSLPESTSTDGALDQSDNSSDSEDESHKIQSAKASSSQSSTGSINNALTNTSISLPRVSSTAGARSAPIRSAASAFDFDEEDDEEPAPPQPKKQKETPSPSDSPSKKLFPRSGERKPVYKHNWVSNDEEDEEEAPPPAQLQRERIAPPPSRMTARVPIYARASATTSSTSSSTTAIRPSLSQARGSRVRNVKEPHECLESGECDDFRQDIEYVLGALRSDSADANMKCLSTVTLARKCTSNEFRQFIRSQGKLRPIFAAFAEAPQDNNFALCASAVIYLMSRDQSQSSTVDSGTLKLFANLLRIERTQLDKTPGSSKYIDNVWSVLCEYVRRVEAAQAGKKITFQLSKEEISPSLLMLESFVFLLARNMDEGTKTELLNMGVLPWLVAKVDQVTLRLSMESLIEVEQLNLLLMLDRCYRVLEQCTLYHKKNQAFLISHRGSLLIQSAARSLDYIRTRLPECTPASPLAHSLVVALDLTARVLINLSHDSELCCTKLGQIPDLMVRVMESLTWLAPKHAPEEKKFDIYVIMCGLLVNLVERCASNRRRVMEATVRVFNWESGEETAACGTIAALVQLFCRHDSKAQSMDESLDQELAMQEPDGEGEEEEEEEDGRLDRRGMAEMDETDMMRLIQGAMNKASAHMEDSVVASYIALVIGCMLQQNEEGVAVVREEMAGGSLRPLVEQMQRFVDFINIAGHHKGNARSIERILDLLQSLDE